MGVSHAVSGAIFAIAWFIFFDGFVTAKDTGEAKYQFVMWLPGLLGLLSMFVIMFVDAAALRDEGGGVFDSGDAPRHKSLFFFGTLLALAGLSIAIWKMSD